MRPTGRLHLGHYHGVLKNWIELQRTHECFFFVADWHALTTHYEDTEVIGNNVWDMVIDWLAAGVDPESATLFIQSRVVEHAELHLLLSMITPLGWLERVPSFKDQQEKLKERDLATYGFLGYPLLQSADILIYKAAQVPVGEDQVPHVELTRELARRFNFLYGREPSFAADAEQAARKMGKQHATQYHRLRKQYQEQGKVEALTAARALIESQHDLSQADRERLVGYVEGTGKIILPEPQPLLTKAAKMPGLDGQKMSKSYGNTIELRESPQSVEQKLRTMPTDPARVRRSDPGEPEKCPVWALHMHYSNDDVQQWVLQGCRTAGIGCLDCKQPVIDAIQAELRPIQQRAREYERDVSVVRRIVEHGCERARAVARKTLDEVRSAMGLGYR
jgi:tryptophanyl-tRNA synthetase